MINKESEEILKDLIRFYYRPIIGKGLVYWKFNKLNKQGGWLTIRKIRNNIDNLTTVEVITKREALDFIRSMCHKALVDWQREEEIIDNLFQYVKANREVTFMGNINFQAFTLRNDMTERNERDYIDILVHKRLIERINNGIKITGKGLETSKYKPPKKPLIDFVRGQYLLAWLSIVVAVVIAVFTLRGCK